VRFFQRKVGLHDYFMVIGEFEATDLL
jgi:hypothetical protein